MMMKSSTYKAPTIYFSGPRDLEICANIPDPLGTAKGSGDCKNVGADRATQIAPTCANHFVSPQRVWGRDDIVRVSGLEDTNRVSGLEDTNRAGKAYPTLAFVNKPNWLPIKMSERRIRHSPLSTNPTGGQSKYRKGVSDTRLWQPTQLVANQNVGKAPPPRIRGIFAKSFGWTVAVNC